MTEPWSNQASASAWTNIAIPGGGWTDNSTNNTGFRWKLQSFGSNFAVWLNVNLEAPGVAPGDGTNIGVMPALAIPATTQRLVLCSSNEIGGGQSPHFTVDTAGNIACWGITANAVITGTSLYPLD